MKKIYFMIGNGFTIDLLNYCPDNLKNKIDVSNLFKYGDCVFWPKEFIPDFLSYKRTPNLWLLGARPSLNKDESLRIIEDIVTCSNVIFSSSKESFFNDSSNIYLNAYAELTMYLKHLFIYYNKQIDDRCLKEASYNFPFIVFLRNKLDKYDEINIISYNYDIFLERMLKLHNFNFAIVGMENEKNAKIKIHKPHGSISFAFEFEDQPSREFKISTESIIFTNPKLNDFITKYEKLENDSSPISAVIPPAADSSRYKFEWSTNIQKNVIKDVKNSNDIDDVIIYGLSYWHVDRSELDEIITNFDLKSNISVINPYPATSFTAVLTSLFKNLTLHNSSKILEVL